jgi:SpoVK/Ycf46/Vps4 family AAA+-type ATPase
MTLSDLFDAIDRLPDAQAQRRYEGLVGLDEVKERLTKEAQILLDPALLKKWSEEHHDGKVIPATHAFDDRIPLFVFAGDVGAGKTALAETFGDPLARAAKLEVMLMRLSLSARGSGAVGEMTKLISAAFDYVEKEISPPVKDNRPTAAAVLLIDEADALAQSREFSQMHHEDRAGVNALIRRIDRVSAQGRPVITVLCTNRFDALDPAITRRAAEVFHFERPNSEQRKFVLQRAFGDTGLSEDEIERLAELTGPCNGRDYGFTFSDLTTRLVPSVVLSAFPDEPVTFERVAALAEQPPTAPFGSEER